MAWNSSHALSRAGTPSDALAGRPGGALAVLVWADLRTLNSLRVSALDPSTSALRKSVMSICSICAAVNRSEAACSAALADCDCASSCEK